METRRKLLQARARLTDSRLAQQQLSRSDHELEFIGASGEFSQSAATPSPALRRRKSEAELAARSTAAPSLADDPSRLTRQAIDDRPVPRRRRFTRKQRKSLTIDPETSLILANGAHSSSSDEDPQVKHVPSRSATRLKQSRGLSVSVNVLSPEEESKQPQKKQFSSRGPAARRASRRGALLKSQVAASATNLDQLKGGGNIRVEKRSMSVRDLNGEEFDFSNKDSVVRWTSQILAELDSLPSSCVSLRETGKIDGLPLFLRRADRKVVNGSHMNDCRRYSTLQTRSSTKPPPVPPHRQSMFEAKGLMDNLSASDGMMTSSVIEPMTSTFGSKKGNFGSEPKGLEDNLTASVDNINSWISSFENLMTTSFHDVMRDSVHSTRSSTITRDREDSNATTLVASSSGSDGEGTPLAVTPVPAEKAAAMSKKPGSSEAAMIFDRMQETCETSPRPIPAPRTVLTTKDRISTSACSAAAKSMQIKAARSIDTNNATEASVLRQDCNVVVGRPPSVIREQQMMSSPLRDAENRLSSSIARLSRSVYGELNEDQKPRETQSDRLPIPTMRRDQCFSEKRIDQTGRSSSELEKWKKRAQCRSRDQHDTVLSMNEPSSVNRVVASLIRSIEDSRYSAPDRPTHLSVESAGQLTSLVEDNTSRRTPGEYWKYWTFNTAMETENATPRDGSHTARLSSPTVDAL